MKKFLIVATLMLLATSVFAIKIKLSIEPSTGVVIGIRDLEWATFVCFKEKQLLTGGIVPLVSYKNLVSFDLGATTNFDEPPVYLLGVGINIKELASLLGLNYNFAVPIRLGLWLGRDFNRGVTKYGINGGFRWKLFE